MSFRIGMMSRKAMAKEAEKEYDVVIVGSGPAGLTAAIYSARYMLDTVVIAGEIGGQMGETGYVENYPGFVRITGQELVKKFTDHVAYYKVPIQMDEVESVERDGDKFKVHTKRGITYRTKTVIIAVGVKRRKLNVPGEQEYTGKGVSYCAPCDAPFFRGRVVAVVGGGDSAASAAILLADYASRVYLIHRRNELRAQPIYKKLLEENPKIKILWSRVVERLEGDTFLRKAILRNRETGETEELELDGIFVEIGADPPRDFLERVGVELDEEGYVKVGPDQSTSIPGIFAAGDCTTGSNKYKQIITAAAEGAVAADAAYNYIIRKFPR